METAAISYLLCLSWEQNIFVMNASNAVIFDMQLAESIPQGVTELFCQILKSVIL
jgi:hypothetical protein